MIWRGASWTRRARRRSRPRSRPSSGRCGSTRSPSRRWSSRAPPRASRSPCAAAREPIFAPWLAISGEPLGVGAHLTALRRLRVGRLRRVAAVPPEPGGPPRRPLLHARPKPSPTCRRRRSTSPSPNACARASRAPSPSLPPTPLAAHHPRPAGEPRGHRRARVTGFAALAHRRAALLSFKCKNCRAVDGRDSSKEGMIPAPPPRLRGPRKPAHSRPPHPPLRRQTRRGRRRCSTGGRSFFCSSAARCRLPDLRPGVSPSGGASNSTPRRRRRPSPPIRWPSSTRSPTPKRR